METRLFITALVGALVGAGIGYALANDKGKEGSLGMSHVMSGMTAGLEGKTGDKFDHAFIDEMIVHHEGAVDMAHQVLERSEREELKALARDIIEAQTREIEMMRGWMREWFGEAH